MMRVSCCMAFALLKERERTRTRYDMERLTADGYGSVST
jgi:hypothetical protein